MQGNASYRVSGERIRRLRERRRMTQQDLAVACGLAVPTISRIETGVHRPRFSTVDRIAEALGVDPDELVDYAPLVA